MVDEFINKMNFKDFLVTMDNFSITGSPDIDNVIYISRVIDIFESCVYQNNKAVIREPNKNLNFNALLSIITAFDKCLRTLMLFKIFSFLENAKLKNIEINSLVKFLII
jgi:hypothetical protein